MTAPLVSIIVPCFNAERWLGITLESALAQTWPNKEIIVINDGSSDGSLALARTFEPRGVKVIDQRNQGAAAARNTGIRASTGAFLQFLDAEDLLSPGKLSAQIELLSHCAPSRVASCRWGRFEIDRDQARFVDDAVYRDFTAIDFLVLAGETGAMMHPSAWLVPVDVAQRAGPWDESLSLNDDGEYFARVALASSGLAYCDEQGARSFYRSGLAGSLSQQRGEKARRSQFRSLELITRKLLAAEDSARTRMACAGYWRRFVHDFYPFPPELIQRAESEVRRLGEDVGRPTMGPRTAALSAIIGWKNVWRLKHFLDR